MCRQQNKRQIHILTPRNWERDLVLCGVSKLSSWDDLGLPGWVLHPMVSVPLRDGRGWERKRLCDLGRRAGSSDCHEPRSTWSLRGRKRQDGPSPGASEGAGPCPHLGFRLLASRTVRDYISANRFVVICYSSLRKGIQSMKHPGVNPSLALEEEGDTLPPAGPRKRELGGGAKAHPPSNLSSC